MGRLIPAPTAAPATTRATSSSTAKVALLFAALIVCSWLRFGLPIPALHLPTSPTNPTPDPKVRPSQDDSRELFDWTTVPATADLEYQPCYDGFECTRLAVPMDWHAEPGDEAFNHTVGLAVIRLRANISVLDERYGGEIYINPGGPGGSGVGMLLGANGAHIQTIVNSPPSEPTGKLYDIVSWDPRGVLHTTPRVSCFADLLARQLWYHRREAVGVIGASDAALPNLWARAHALGSACEDPEIAAEARLLRGYVATPYVVRDMVEMLEKSGELREREPRRELAMLSSVGRGAGFVEETLERLRYRPGEEKLQYWGFSYGSLLGQTFAAMYPERAHRVIVDGIVDAPDYMASGWTTNLRESEAVLAAFFTACASAGPSRCPFASTANTTSASTLRTTYDAILADLTAEPLAVAPPAAHAPPDIVTASDLRWLVFRSLYKPYADFLPLATILADLARRNGSSLAAYMADQRGGATLVTPCDSSSSSSSSSSSFPSCTLESCLDHGAWFDETSSAILCTDGLSTPPRTASSLASFTAYTALLESQSPSLGGAWARIQLACTGWTPLARWRFPGPFENITTAGPVLFVANEADPVTPGANARRMAQGFVGARVLVREGVGHCSISAPSRCVAERVRGFFQRGEMPDDGEWCAVEGGPFDGGWEVSEGEGEGGDEALGRALWGMATSERGMGGPLGI